MINEGSIQDNSMVTLKYGDKPYPHNQSSLQELAVAQLGIYDAILPKDTSGSDNSEWQI